MVDIDTIVADVAPVYKRYPGQTSPQGAFLEIDPETDSAYWSHDPEIGGAVPAHVWHGREIRISCSPCLSSQQIKDLSETLRPLIERVIDGYSCEWDGHNRVGRLDDDATEAELELHAALAGVEGDEQIWDAGDWIYAGGDTSERIWTDLCAECGIDPGREDGDALDAIIDHVERVALADDIVLDRTERAVRALRQEWQDAQDDQDDQ